MSDKVRERVRLTSSYTKQSHWFLVQVEDNPFLP